MAASPGSPKRDADQADVLVRVRGIVQGVGFRPFVHRVASRMRLRGWVRNDTQGVLIRASGEEEAVQALVRSLESEAPPAARVLSVERADFGSPVPDSMAAYGMPAGPAGDGFSILPSESGGMVVEAAAPPDLALCTDCRRELLDPADRRFRYPFINCTQCGPRYSILERLPYDRPRTTMRAFRMCPACQTEYDDPASRRFHAQPNACPVCGPQAFLVDEAGQESAGEEGLERTAALLSAGGIIAVKGIGGYHLIADAGSEGAVAELRRRKHREEKPLAVMFPSMEAIREAAEVSPEAEALLLSPAAPIVLLRRKPKARLALGIAPDNPWVGALLPYAPLQVLLLEAFGKPVVATSANLSDEPLCTDNHEAQRRLSGIADAFYEHNRRIAHPVDDSVVRLCADGPIRLRRARGYAPIPLMLPGRVGGCLLCVGAQMKSTLSVAAGDRVVVSPHIGDLDGPSTRTVFQRTADVLGALQGSDFTAVACDRHPDYASTRYAEATGLPRVAIQHHLAHVLSCLLENRHPADGVLGVSWDGTGYGEDGTVWGGEFLLLRQNTALRFARVRPFRLAGGEAAIRDGRRSALGLVHAAAPGLFDAAATALRVSPADAATLRTMLARGLNSPVTSSAGRLFDAVGALLGLGGRNQFEGQTPLAVEAAAVRDTGGSRILPLPLRAVPKGGSAVWELDWEPLLDELLGSKTRVTEAPALAAGFHRGLARAIAAIAREAGVGTVALTGGCFQNALLSDLASSALRKDGFTVLAHRELPPNDGGISAGQALGALLSLSCVQMP